MVMHCGLWTDAKICPSSEYQAEPEPVSLIHVSVHASIVDLVAQVTISQHYVNRETNPIEAVYMFPLDDGAAVCQFTAEVDGRFLGGVVKETKQAEKEYREGIESGHTAFLVEEKLSDVFKAKVGNLGPGSKAKFCLTYVTELKVEGGEIRFFLPTTIAPRYISNTKPSSVTVDLASINYTKETAYRVEFKAEIKAASEIKQISSPTHSIIVARNEVDGKHEASLGQALTSMDRDLVLYIQVENPHDPRVLCEKSVSGSIALMLSLVPSFKLADQKAEFIFVVDRSGSMSGGGIKQAKNALKLFLHSLPSDCYINIIGFGSRHASIFPTSRKYDDQVLCSTKSHADGIQADMGGTEIYDPLEWIFGLPVVEGYLRQIFILTDGEVDNPDAVISLVRKNNCQARVFALGLGSSASHHLVEGIARAGNGTALFASLEERLEKKILLQLHDAMQPALTDVVVHWDGYDDQPSEKKVPIQTEKTLLGYGKPISSEDKTDAIKLFRQAPRKCPPVFDGRHLVVYGLLQKDVQVPKTVTLVASSPDGPLSVKLEVKGNNDTDQMMIHRLAAKKLIQDLQDTGAEANKKEIIELGCQYGLASKFTSYVAVDAKEQELKDSWMLMKSRDIPSTLAHGWGGMMYRSAPTPATDGGAPRRLYSRSTPMFATDVGAPPSPPFISQGPRAMCDAAPPPPPAPSALFIRSVPLANQMTSARPIMAVAQGPSVFDSSNKISKSALETDYDKLIKLVSTQSFNGAFRLSQILAGLLETTLEDLQNDVGDEEHSEIWATLLSLAYMELTLSDLEGSWMLVASKAERWLRTLNYSNLDSKKQIAEDYIKLKLNL